MNNLAKGYVQVYTGDGKGKTTAAIGQGVRAAGAGLNVYMVQFLKSRGSGELNSLKKLEPNFKVFRFERERGFFWALTDKEKEELKEEVKKAFEFCEDVLKNNKCDLLILDEIMWGIENKLLEQEDLLHLMSIKPENMELILTGRNVPLKILDKADLVTEMREVKHYFRKGVQGRKGIEF